jgi:hypothetical protein
MDKLWPLIEYSIVIFGLGMLAGAWWRTRTYPDRRYWRPGISVVLGVPGYRR